MAIGAVLGTALGVDMARVKDGNDRCSGIYPWLCVAALCWVYLTVGCTMGGGDGDVSLSRTGRRSTGGHSPDSLAGAGMPQPRPQIPEEKNQGAGLFVGSGFFLSRFCQPHDDVTAADRVRGLPVRSPQYSQAQENDTQRGMRAGCGLRATSCRDGAGANLGPIRTSKQASLQRDKLKHRRLAGWRYSEANRAEPPPSQVTTIR